MTKTAALPVEGSLPSFGGATGWLNSRPLTAEGLRGKVVAVQFCTFSCINWLRTVPYLMAWAAKYQGDGLVTIGVHSPEFPFEHDVSAVETALAELEVSYPIAVDNDFAVWRAFDNHYWPALYLIDGRGASGTTTSARTATGSRRAPSSTCSSRPARRSTWTSRRWSRPVST